MANITKKNIIESVSDKTGLTQVDTRIVVETFLEAISKSLQTGKNIEIRGFGRFKLKPRKARQVRNPRTGEVVNIEAGMLGDLLDDYERVEGAREEVRLVGGVIRLSAHVLRVDKNQLPSQLCGRLLDNKARPIGVLLQSASKYTHHPWLRPLTASLLHTGGALVKTLNGHTHDLKRVSVTADGSVAVSAFTDGTLKVWDLKKGTELHTLSGHSDEITGVSGEIREARRTVVSFGSL
jgi:nucleoid DNA-binding protein